MGKVITKLKVQNWSDVELLALGIRSEAPRFAELEALVDTGATFFYLRASVVRQLGLRFIREMTAMSDRTETRKVYSPVDLEIQGRRTTSEVIELPDTLPNIVGQIPLEALDWVVDLRSQRLIPNPDHKAGELSEEF